MDYQQTVQYLYSALPMFSRQGSAALKPNLNNITALCAHLGNPQNKFKAVHIGGTNGKGSVSHMLAAALQTAGYKTGLHTSPHLTDLRERMRVDGQLPTEAFVIQFVARWKNVIEDLQPSFFEITVAMAFQYFAEQNVDVAVVEVGLGGRLDSTNILLPVLSIITNISWDHMDLLGNTLPQIAAEKGGIIKPGVPVVLGERNAETAPVFEKVAAEKGAPLFFAPDFFTVTNFTLLPNALQATVTQPHGDLKKITLDLPGLYQTRNLPTVLHSVALLNKIGFIISDAVLKNALQNVKKRTGLQGRWEVVRQQPTVVLEVAHNTAGIQQMRQHLQALPATQVHLVLGMVRDKEIAAVLQLLPRDATYYFTQAHIPRALEASALQQQAAAHGLVGSVYSDVNAALQQALAVAQPTDVIVVCGSIFLVAEVDREAIGN